MQPTSNAAPRDAAPAECNGRDTRDRYRQPAISSGRARFERAADAAVGHYGSEMPADDCAGWVRRAHSPAPAFVRLPENLLGSSRIATLAIEAPQTGQRHQGVWMIGPPRRRALRIRRRLATGVASRLCHAFDVALSHVAEGGHEPRISECRP